MANLTSIARPYAVAAFQIAREKQELSAWKMFLSAASMIAENQAVMRLLHDPAVSADKLVALFASVLNSIINAEQKNFLRILAEYDRFDLLPEIEKIYIQQMAHIERSSIVRLVSAVAIDSDFQEKLKNALAKRTQSEVTLECEIDPTIMGGAVIYIGDRVIDGSIRGKLTRLLEFSLR